ncbi:DNA cytosine methyltransferase [Succinivibrio sp.]|uniref:DNA cytosine methyltransferase n=1 Tax=Succinivibrio sp. TaxID=2053619 RepID=UPI0025EBB11A|nr:DNA cytosine methyltransferase [Succinivibrio sp.]MBQ9221166.1 DNA (cytosine-5-)-methyltransferase [Succinivibrio sp.]
MPNFLDLFAGAGGLSEGFIRANYSPVAHIEMDPAACYTLKTRVAYHWLKNNNNISIYNDYLNGLISREQFYSKVPQKELDSVLHYEISKENLPEIFNKVDSILDGAQLDFIIGGPPCQAYSLAGRSRSKTNMIGDKRNYLYLLYAEFLKRYKPKFFVFENVLGLLSAKDQDGSKHFDNMRKLFSEIGYSTEFKVLTASDFGVLQNRKRIIMIGIKGQEENFYPNLQVIKEHYLVNELFSDLPHLQSGEGVNTPVKTLKYRGDYLYKVGIKEFPNEPITLHQSRPNNEQDLQIYKIAVNEWNKSHKRISYMDLPEKLRTHSNIDSFLDRFKVVAADLPCSQTIVAHIAKDGHYFIHPDITQNRSITPREAARIQTFPDNYYFESASGKPSRTLAFKQIGNAVPVHLAYVVASALLHKYKTK